MERRLAAILAADVVGYSRLVGSDEESTLGALKRLRVEFIEPLIADHRGRVVKLMGDGILVEFQSAVDAVKCAVAWQEDIAQHEGGDYLKFRIGVNLGDIVVDADDILGDGVNIAARLEGLAEPGGIVISDMVLQNVQTKLDHRFADQGTLALKNIDQPVRIWTWVGDGFDPGKHDNSQSQPDRPSIAVLPFTNMSGDPEQEYFSDGLTEDIITELSRFRNLFVIARNSSFTYKGQAVKIQEVARDLGVNHVVEGSVRKAGNRVRVTAQLVDGLNGNHLWVERYDRDLEDIFAVQDEIAQSIVSCLPGRLENAGTELAKRKHTSNMNAYDYLLLGLERFRRFTKEKNAEARILFRKAVELDPLYARAHALLASTDVWDVLTEWRDEPLDSAFESVQTALSLDHDDSWSHAILGYMLFLRGQDEEADHELQQAIALNANDADVAAVAANVLVYFGRWEEALDRINKAIRLNPHPPGSYHWYQALALFSGRNYEQTIKAIRKVGPDYAPGHAYLAACYAHLHRLDEATAALATFSEIRTELLEASGNDVHPSNAALLRERATRYRVPGDSEHLLAGLRKAGLPL
jgi:adenylate cyclase